jgi:hypothetical protein
MVEAGAIPAARRKGSALRLVLSEGSWASPIACCGERMGGALIAARQSIRRLPSDPVNRPVRGHDPAVAANHLPFAVSLLSSAHQRGLLLTKRGSCEKLLNPAPVISPRPPKKPAPAREGAGMHVA